MDRDGNPDKRMLYGAVLIGIGVLLLLLQMYGNAGHYVWPFFIITPGVLLALLGAVGGRRSRHAAVSGAMLAGVGTILLVQTVFDYFQSWAYAWTLLPFFAGAGLVFASRGEGDPELAVTGRSMMRWSAVAFAVLAILFEVLIFDGGLFGGRYIAPVILIVIGSFLVFSRFGHGHPSSGSPDPSSWSRRRPARSEPVHDNGGDDDVADRLGDGDQSEK